MISCIIPCYGSEGTIAGVVDELKSTFLDRGVSDFEVILVNDASPDGLFDVIRQLCLDHDFVRGIDLSRNFGQHNAIMAGLSRAQGDICVFLDDDGQTPGSEVWKLIDALDDTCDVVFAKYTSKQHSFLRNLGSRMNSLMAELLVSKPTHLYFSSYVACKRYIAEELLRYDGSDTYLSGLLIRASNRVKNVVVEHREREVGKSGYTTKRLLSLWLNGFTAFSVKPLRLASLMGFLVASVGFVYGVYILIKKLFIAPYVPLGWSSTMAVILFMCGIIMIMLGMIGEYLGRVYIKLNHSPQYVIREEIGFLEERGS